MSASADVLAQAKVEIALEAIPEGKNVSGALFSFSARLSFEKLVRLAGLLKCD